jgi:hypothetical protein
MAHTIKVELNITTVQKLDDVSADARIHLIHEAVAARVDSWVGDTIDRIGADSSSEYEITDATVVQVLDRDAFAIVELEVIIERVEGKFAPRAELEDGVNELATDLVDDITDEPLGESGAFVITEATVGDVR